MGGRRIDYLRISVTDRCNFRCLYCQPPEGIEYQDPDRIMSFDEIVTFTQAAVAEGITRVRITGGEPLVRRGVVSLVARLAAMDGIKDLSLTTNGALLAGHATALKAAGLSRINISIDSLSAARFARITRGAVLEPVLAGLDAALDAGFTPVKVNAVMLEGIEDDLDRFVRLARERPVHVRFIEFMPIGRRRGGLWKFVPRQRLLERLAAYGELKPVTAPVGAGPARYFRFDGAAGTIGFISSMSDHFCARCNRLRLTADGWLRNCLFSDAEIDVQPHIAGDAAVLRRVITDSMNSKKFDRSGVAPGKRTMSQIGG
ncbi:MAG: GTP 3',8-cyclase MoaA [Thermoleophilia bacterium]